MRMIDADALKEQTTKKNHIWDSVTDIYGRGLTEIIDSLPTVDAVPRQKYEEDMESAFAHGHTDAESNFRKMIADGELVEVVRCKDCKYFDSEDDCGCPMDVRYSDFFCKMGERTDEETIHQYHERHKEVLKEMSMPVGRNVMDALKERKDDGQ